MGVSTGVIEIGDVITTVGVKAVVMTAEIVVAAWLSVTTLTAGVVTGGRVDGKEVCATGQTVVY
jgi:hypothetical protein